MWSSFCRQGLKQTGNPRKKALYLDNVQIYGFPTH